MGREGSGGEGRGSRAAAGLTGRPLVGGRAKRCLTDNVLVR